MKDKVINANSQPTPSKIDLTFPEGPSSKEWEMVRSKRVKTNIVDMKQPSGGTKEDRRSKQKDVKQKSESQGKLEKEKHSVILGDSTISNIEEWKISISHLHLSLIYIWCIYLTSCAMAELVELVTSDPVVFSVSSFSTNKILQLKELLEFVSSKDQCKWKGNAEELAELISLILDTDERPQLSEDPVQNLLSFKILNIIVKWWKKTLTIAIQGKEHRMFKDNLVDLLKLKSSSDANRLTIAEENGGNMGQVSLIQRAQQSLMEFRRY